MSDPLGLISNTAAAGLRPALAPKAGDAVGGPSFKDVLMKNIEQVNQLQQDAEKAIEDLATGQRNDLDGVLIAKQKADMAFQLLLQVRNKMVDAYEEIKQMRV
jgi:flagellar hook-basal body complex protein FliE